MRPLLFLYFLIFTPLFLFSEENPETFYPVKEESQVFLLNGTWDFMYIPGGVLPESEKGFYKPGFSCQRWGQIKVPSNWELEGKAEPKYAKSLERGIGLYRRTFTLPDDFLKDRLIIRLEGVLYAYSLYINGEYAGKWKSAYNARQFDITSLVHPDRENLIALKVDTYTPNNSQWFDVSDGWALSGIFRDVLLFSLPNVHLNNLQINCQLQNDGSARFSIDAGVNDYRNQSREKLLLKGRLKAPCKEEVFSFAEPLQTEFSENPFLRWETYIQTPLLWSAEDPSLYELTLQLFRGEKLVQTVQEQVGIREIKTVNGVFTINNRPVKLKGVNMHEIHPERGRALTRQDRIRDLKLAKGANINCIRTSHYPHHPDFFELCDSMGFYVICEVPFNFSPPGVSKNFDYLPELITRARATLSRYKNHPSIITWSIGNENHLAEIYTRVGEFVAMKDPSRPRCFPQSPTAFAEEWKKTPEIFNVLAPHYLLPGELKSLAGEAQRPVIMTEYAHSLGLSTENMEDNWEIIREHPRLAGACLWMWADQGIRREHTKEAFLADSLVQGVWTDSTTYLDGSGERGTDGIVYANRYPQADYWLAQKVYSPLWVMNEKITASPGTRKLQILLQNRFNFLTLEGFTCNWTFHHFSKKIDAGKISLKYSQNQEQFIVVPVKIPDVFPGEFFLTLRFYDPEGEECYRTRIQVLTGPGEVNYRKLNANSGEKTNPQFRTQNEVISFSAGQKKFDFHRDGKITYISEAKGDTLIHAKPLLRVGRKPTITLKYQGERYLRKGWFEDIFYWEPWVLGNPEILSREIGSDRGGKFSITGKYRWRASPGSNEYIEGNVTFEMLPNGTISCHYSLTPHQVTHIFLECGLGFPLPEIFNAFYWLGEGPFVSVPGKTKYTNRGVWKLHKNDIRLNGNRAKTDVALLSSQKGNKGLAFLGFGSNFELEFIDNIPVFNHNALVAGFGTKVNFTRYYKKPEDIDTMEGHFDFTAFGNHSRLGRQIFGSMGDLEAKNPFLKSYGF